MNDNELFFTIKNALGSNQALNVKYDVIHDIAFHVFLKCIDHLQDGAARNYSLTEELFQGYMYEWNIIGAKGVPFEYWSDLAKEGLELLAEMIENNNLNYKQNPKFRPFIKKIANRIVELKKNPEFQNHFDELID